MIEKSDFKAAWWLRNANAQTIWPALLRRPVKLKWREERLELPDGDFVDLNWINEDSKGPIVIMLHGLCGSIKSSYATPLLRSIKKKGWRGLFMHFRGCSGQPNRLQRWYHSGDTGDFNYLLEILQSREPNTKLAAVGYSLGGNALLKWLGETQATTPLSAAVAVSVPFDLAIASKNMETGFSRVYQRQFIREMREYVEMKSNHIDLPYDLKKLKTLKTFKHFDDYVTAPAHGFSDAKDYYTRASSRQFLKDINIPTLVLHAEDDPIMTPAAIPRKEELSDKIRFELSKRGGHVGFVTGRVPGFHKYWLDERIIRYFNDFL